MGDLTNRYLGQDSGFTPIRNSRGQRIIREDDGTSRSPGHMKLRGEAYDNEGNIVSAD